MRGTAERMWTLQEYDDALTKAEAALTTANEENEKPIRIRLFRICCHCNKEFEAETTPIMGECIGGVARGEIHNFMDCPLCKKRNDIWVRIQALKGQPPCPE